MGIVWHGDLRRRFFKVPSIMAHLVAATKDDLTESVDRSCQELKYQDFVQRSKIIHSELLHMEMLKRKNLIFFFNRTNQDRATWVTFYINLLINVIYLVRMKVNRGEDGQIPEGEQEWTLDGHSFEVLLLVFNYLQIFLSSFTLLLYTMVRAPVMFSYEYRKSHSFVTSFIKMWTTSYLAYYLVYVAFAVLGLMLENLGPLFNTFLLYDIVVKNSTFRDVLRAVYTPARQLGATLMLLVFTVYVFSMSLFLYFRDDFESGECDNVSTCFMVTLGFGLRMGGGVGEYLDFDTRALGPRYILDLAYYAFVLIILLNIVFGIIIDTFSELREKKKIRLQDTKEKCFMCGIDKATFDRVGSSVFQAHIKSEHNMWAYLKFIVAIWEQDEDDDDGLESYVRQAIDNRDHEWLPAAQCLTLPHHKEGDDAHGSTQKEIMERVNDLGQKVNSIVTVLKDIGSMTQQMQQQQLNEAISKRHQEK